MTHSPLGNARNALQDLVVARALRDPGFRSLLLESPRDAIEGELGVKLPEATRVVALAESRDLLCVTVPVELSGISPAAVQAATGDVRAHRPALDRDTAF